MGFNEKVHAFIAAKFYVHLTEQFGERGRLAFIHGTQYYAEQRGRRMAQRAIRDGNPLTYEVYKQYGEWVNSPEVAAEKGHTSEVVSVAPDSVSKITRCPWHSQFKEMGLVEAGHEYCKHLDNSICRGFNPYIVYEVPQTLHKSEYCLHIIRDAGLSPDSNLKKKMEYVKEWDYHCAHSYWSYSEVTAAIFGAEGEAVNAQVLADFEKEYGKEMADTLVTYRGTNFNVC
ncbi:MAG: hypothetical protein DBY34_04640 [Oscillospiraceae bacterium]|nr:MAG: hypothetical protein DBY34_04640 [Oscillospiraceae bacterium]